MVIVIVMMKIVVNGAQMIQTLTVIKVLLLVLQDVLVHSRPIAAKLMTLDIVNGW